MVLSSTAPVVNHPLVLAECPDFGYVIGDTKSPRRTKAAVPSNCARPEFGGRMVSLFQIWDFGDGRGEGCTHCHHTGQVAVYQRRDIDPYLRLYRCPHC